MKIKICGITNIDDARAACEYGADAVGFIFVPSSARYVAPERAADIVAALPARILTVGVVVNQKREAVKDILLASGVRALQFHGDESPEALRGFDVPVYKAHRVGPGFCLDTLEPYAAEAHLLDAFVEGKRGGTGEQFDWNIAAGAARRHRIILSGGLHPENIARAIEQVRPQGVDVSSGVELRPGVKDHARMSAFIESAQNALQKVMNI